MRQLRNGTVVVPEIFDLVTVMFSDVPNFAEFVQHHSPIHVTDFLVNLDLMLQKAMFSMDECRIEMISDCYMVCVRA